MTKTVALMTIVLATATATAQPAPPPPPSQPKETAEQTELVNDFVGYVGSSLYRDDKTGSWNAIDQAGNMEGSKCAKAWAKVVKAGVPGSRPVQLASDTPELVKGKYTLDDLRPICENIDRLVKIHAWEMWGILAARESFKIGGNSYYDVRQFQLCVDVYDDMIKAGVKPTAKVPHREFEQSGNPIVWNGTVEEMRKKWCDIGLAKVKAETAVAEAPYRKVLKADKLTMALQTGTFYIQGGKTTSDPKKLAAAKVWFSDTQSVNSDRNVCKGGAEIHIVHRYQFDATHKLVKTTDTQHCGKVPASAYK